MQLREEYADLVIHLSSSQVEEFAFSLRSKRMWTLSAMMPFTYAWLEENLPDIIKAFQDISVSSRLTDRTEVSRKFVDFIEECRDFYDDVPAALPDVARLEFLLLSHRSESGSTQAQTDVVAPRFSWESLYWKPSRTTAAAFSSDALSILLGRKKMESDSEPTWMVIAEKNSGGRPTTLRITESAFHVFAGLEEPVSASALLEYTDARQLKVSKDALKALLMRLDQSDIIGSYHVNEVTVDGG
jgi:hypothetical protein